MRMLFSDNLDTGGGSELLDNPYKMESSTFKNKDWYGFLTVFLTYDFGLRDCKCNKDDK